MEFFGETTEAKPAGEGEEDGLAPNLLGSFIGELEESIANLEQKLVELETSPKNAELVNSIFRAFHNLKGSSTMVGLKILPELMHWAESVLSQVRSGFLEVTESVIVTLSDVFGSMREVRESLRADGTEGKKRYFSILAALEAIVDSASKTTVSEAEAANAEAHPTAKQASKLSAEDDFIKISRSLVEQLMLVVGDFMLVESSFQFMKDRYSSDWSFAENCQQLSHFSNKLQNTVLKMRLSPIKPVFSSMHRLVRTTAAGIGKKVALEVNGLETLVDRTVLDVIADPLIHMLRNSVDHGLEMPSDRLSLGKPEEGQITLAAFHKAGEVVIQISDDGRGITPSIIKAKAIEKGFITSAEAAKLSDLDAQRLIFLPGFSGAEKVTDLSGRGVGMDVVKQVVVSLGGNLDLVSNPGAGTTITMRLPLSMAISECLEFRLGSASYAVAQVNVDEVFSVQSPLIKDSLKTVNDGSPVLIIRDIPMPVLDLGKIFEVETDLSEAHVIQVRFGTNRFALLVGAIVGPCNIVCQPLPSVFSSDAPFSGVTRRGDGTLMFQIDLARLAAMHIIQNESNTSSAAKIRGGTSITSSDLRRLQQKIAVFRNGELFCVPVQSIKRMVLIDVKDIHVVSGRTFVTLDSVTIPLVWIEEVLLGTARFAQTQYRILVYQVEEHYFGLPMNEFVGIVRMPTQYDNTMRSDIIIGSTIIGAETCMVVDLYGLTARAFGSEVNVKVKEMHKIKKLALAEDDPFFREQLIAFLAARGLECISFPDGLALKEFLMVPENAASVDAVLSDIEMPRMDGLTVVRWIKGTEHTKSLPCIIITSLTNKEVARLAISAGASAFVPKMHHKQVLTELKRIESGIESHEGGAASQEIDNKPVIKRLVTFYIGTDAFAMPMEVLKEVSHPSPNLPIPRHISGQGRVTAFRGKMVPVIDLCKLFGLKSAAENGVMQQAIVDCNGEIIAVLFDTIGEVLLMSQLTPGEGITKLANRSTDISAFLRGIYQREQKIYSIIEPEALVKCYVNEEQLAIKGGNVA